MEILVAILSRLENLKTSSRPVKSAAYKKAMFHFFNCIGLLLVRSYCSAGCYLDGKVITQKKKLLKKKLVSDCKSSTWLDYS